MKTPVTLATIALSLLLAGYLFARTEPAAGSSVRPTGSEPVVEVIAMDEEPAVAEPVDSMSETPEPVPAESATDLLDQPVNELIEPEATESDVTVTGELDVDPADEAPGFVPSAPLPAPEFDTPGAMQIDTQKVSIDFPDEEIRTILRVVADMFDLNLVIPEALTGRSSLKLRNVAWRQVFDVVLSPVGFTFVEDGGIIRVVSLEELTREPPITEVIILNYSRAEEITTTVTPLVIADLGGRIQVDRRSNALVITERPSQMRRIRAIIETLDQPTAQVMIESKFIETSSSSLRNIGVNWASLEGYEVTAGPFDRTYSKQNIQDRTSGRDSSTSSSSESSTQQQQGVSGGNAINNSMSTTSATAGSTAGAFNELVSSQNTTRLTTAVFSADELNVIISALQTTDDVKLVSNPTLVTLNNTPAMISIGERFPIPQYVYNAERGVFEVSGFDFEDIGIIINVTPQVNPRGFINLNINPEVSTRTGMTNFGGAGGAEIPIIASRRTESQIMIRDGYTLAIGGLSEDVTTNTSSKVPVLGDVPGLGRLFRSESKGVDHRNLIIFITARTLNPDGSSFEEVIDPRMTRAMNLTRQDIPGYRPNIDHFPPVEVMPEPEPVEDTRRGSSRRMRQPGGRPSADSQPQAEETAPVLDTSPPPPPAPPEEPPSAVFQTSPRTEREPATAGSDDSAISHSEAARALRERQAAPTGPLP